MKDYSANRKWRWKRKNDASLTGDAVDFRSTRRPFCPTRTATCATVCKKRGIILQTRVLWWKWICWQWLWLNAADSSLSTVSDAAWDGTLDDVMLTSLRFPGEDLILVPAVDMKGWYPFSLGAVGWLIQLSLVLPNVVESNWEEATSCFELTTQNSSSYIDWYSSLFVILFVSWLPHGGFFAFSQQCNASG